MPRKTDCEFYFGNPLLNVPRSPFNGDFWPSFIALLGTYALLQPVFFRNNPSNCGTWSTGAKSSSAHCAALPRAWIHHFEPNDKEASKASSFFFQRIFETEGYVLLEACLGEKRVEEPASAEISPSLPPSAAWAYYSPFKTY